MSWIASRKGPSDDVRIDAPGIAHWRHFRLLGGVLLLLVVIGAIYSHALSDRLSTSVARMDALRRTVEESRRFLGYVVDLEAGVRGYLLTADPGQLDSYRVADAALPEQLQLLEGLLKGLLYDRPDLGAKIDQMRATLARKRQDMALMLAGAGAVGTVKAPVSGDLGKFEMDQLRVSTRALEAALNDAVFEERDRIAGLIAERSFSMNLTLGFVAAIGITAMLLVEGYFAAQRRQQALREEAERSRDASDAKTAFLAHVSHEIRTPMNAIFGYGGLLRDRVGDPVGRRYVEALISSARSLLVLIDDLLDLSRIEAGRMNIAEAPTSLREVVDGVLTMFFPQAQAKGIALDAVVGSEVPPSLSLDGDRIRQILVNLVGNALRYTEEGSVSVRVHATPATGTDLSCRIEVEDTGMGIAESDFETIFEPFARAPGSGVAAPRGTGLGLSITRQLVRAMGGDVTVASQPGRGACFTVTLPRVQVSTRQVDRKTPRVRLRDLTALRALVVDDADQNRGMLVAMLRESGHHAREARGGAEALRMLESWAPDVVLADIRMPGISGVDLARRVREMEHLPGVRIVAVTASGMQAMAEVEHVFDGIVVKPYTENTLATELMRVLERRSGEGSPPNPPSGLKPATEPAGAPVTPALVDELDGVLANVWPAVSDALTLGDVRAFAGRLAAIGRRNHNQAVIQYARWLGAAAADVDVARIEALLADFPRRVAALRARREGEA